MIIAIFTLTACSSYKNTQTPNTYTDESVAYDLANQFLEKSDDELLDICQKFYLIRYDESDFNNESITSAQDISQTGMYIFFTTTCETESYLNNQDEHFHFPVKDIQNYIDMYFDGYNFKPLEVKYKGYDTDKDEFIVQALASPSMGFPEITDKKVVDNNTVQLKINYYDRWNDQNSMDITDVFTITLDITEGGYKFVSSIAG